MVCPPFRCTCTPCLLHVLFKVLTQALMVWNNNMCLVDGKLFWPGGFGTFSVIFVSSFFLGSLV